MDDGRHAVTILSVTAADFFSFLTFSCSKLHYILCAQLWLKNRYGACDNTAECVSDPRKGRRLGADCLHASPLVFELGWRAFYSALQAISVREWGRVSHMWVVLIQSHITEVFVADTPDRDLCTRLGANRQHKQGQKHSRETLWDAY